MTWIEGVAALFGFLCVWFTIKQNILCWPTGLVQVFLYIFVFYGAKLYADMILHIIYVGLSIYGWIHWRTGSKLGLPVTHVERLWVWILVLGGLSLAWGYSLTFTDASVPYYDSFIVAASLIAQWLMARKKLESWLFWIAADVVAINIYAYKSLYLTSALYAAFLIMAVLGYWSWQKSYRERVVVAR